MFTLSMIITNVISYIFILPPNDSEAQITLLGTNNFYI